MRWLLICLVGFLVGVLAGPGAAWAMTELHYRCDGDPLQALYSNGPVDDPRVGNQAGGTVPGAFVVLRWRDLSLQIPRTNDAGPPTYADGKWYWGLQSPEAPTFFLKLGDRQYFDCRLEP